MMCNSANHVWWINYQFYLEYVNHLLGSIHFVLHFAGMLWSWTIRKHKWDFLYQIDYKKKFTIHNTMRMKRNAFSTHTILASYQYYFQKSKEKSANYLKSLRFASTQTFCNLFDRKLLINWLWAACERSNFDYDEDKSKYYTVYTHAYLLLAGFILSTTVLGEFPINIYKYTH